MEFQYTHYKVTPDQTLKNIESYLISIQAVPDTEWNEEMKKHFNAKYVVLFPEGEYALHTHDGDCFESFIPKT